MPVVLLLAHRPNQLQGKVQRQPIHHALDRRLRQLPKRGALLKVAADGAYAQVLRRACVRAQQRAAAASAEALVLLVAASV